MNCYEQRTIVKLRKALRRYFTCAGARRCSQVHAAGVEGKLRMAGRRWTDGGQVGRGEPAPIFFGAWRAPKNGDQQEPQEERERAARKKLGIEAKIIS